MYMPSFIITSHFYLYYYSIFICWNSVWDFDPRDPKCNPDFPFLLVRYIYAKFHQKSLTKTTDPKCNPDFRSCPCKVHICKVSSENFNLKWIIRPESTFLFLETMILMQLIPSAISTFLFLCATLCKVSFVISQSYMKLLTGNHFSMFGNIEPDPLTPNLIPNFLSF